MAILVPSQNDERPILELTDLGASNEGTAPLEKANNTMSALMNSRAHFFASLALMSAVAWSSPSFAQNEGDLQGAGKSAEGSAKPTAEPEAAEADKKTEAKKTEDNKPKEGESAAANKEAEGSDADEPPPPPLKIETNCTDRKDNDNDGVIDCADADCYLSLIHI